MHRPGSMTGMLMVMALICVTRTPAPAQDRTVTIQVSATQAWISTGVTLSPGMTVQIRASGTVEASSPSDTRPFYHRVPPEGRWERHAYTPAPLLPALALLGRIGTGPVLLVGAGAQFDVGPPYGSGELFLRINDDIVADNSGAWTVSVTLSRSAIGGQPVAMPAPAPAPGVCRGFAGVWNLREFGRTVLTQDGNRISGTYDRGTLAGTLTANVLEGEWANTKGNGLRGTTRLELLPDGSLKGTAETTGWGGNIVGVCDGQQVAAPAPAPSVCRGLAGVWKLNEFGRTVLTQEGARINGTYDRGGTLAGTLKANVLEGEWVNSPPPKNNGLRGTMRLELLPDGSLKGVAETTGWGGNIVGTCDTGPTAP